METNEKIITDDEIEILESLIKLPLTFDEDYRNIGETFDEDE